jgi:hypothetical protein
MGAGRKAWNKADADLPQMKGAMRAAAEDDGGTRH